MASPLQIGEAAIFDYLLPLCTGDTEDVEAFREELPAVFNDEDITKVWTAHFLGGGEPDTTDTRTGVRD